MDAHRNVRKRTVRSRRPVRRAAATRPAAGVAATGCFLFFCPRTMLIGIGFGY
ncbi:MAG TPA: hypothetical protein VFQ27_02495 [Xanthobacteraceae bacterium]|nr:hypothetical protein [Xanthobacteraceae bacterium]